MKNEVKTKIACAFYFTIHLLCFILRSIFCAFILRSFFGVSVFDFMYLIYLMYFIYFIYLMYWIYLMYLMYFIYFIHLMYWIYLIDLITHNNKNNTRGAREARPPCVVGAPKARLLLCVIRSIK